MNLPTAQAYATKIAAWLQPHCTRLEIAGSIRRERPAPADVDIVCIPRITIERDLLGNPVSRTNHALQFLQAYVAEKRQGLSPCDNTPPCFQSGGDKEGKQVIVQLPKCQLDLWFATPANIGTRLLCRTGSKEHNILLASRAQELGGSWNPYEGVTMNGVLLPATTEQEVYDSMKLPWIEPRDREGEFVAKLIRQGNERQGNKTSSHSLAEHSPAIAP